MVSSFEIFQYLIIAFFASLSDHLLISSLCSYLWICGHKDLKFRIGEDNACNISAVHNDSFGLPHAPLLIDQTVTHVGYGCHWTYEFRYGKSSDVSLDILTIEEGVVAVVYFVEVYLDMIEMWFNGILIIYIHLMRYEMIGDSTIHSTRVDVLIR